MLLIGNLWADKAVVVTGHLADVSGSSTKYTSTFATPVTVRREKNKITPVGVITHPAAGEYTAKGLVIAINTREFMLTDGTGDVLVYKNTQSTEKVGDVVEAKGTATLRGEVIQFDGKGPMVAPISTGSIVPVAMAS